MTSRLFLHIGLHKTGTTYLQNLLRANRKQLRGQGVAFPGGTDNLVQTFAVWDLLGRRPRRAKDARIAGQWARLVESVRLDDAPAALISEERLSLVNVKQARLVVESFSTTGIDVIVTARDLGRVLVSAWQEELKNDKTFTWAEYAAALRNLDQRFVTPARGFWMRQDLPAILETWRAVVPADRIHVVTVPPPGTDPSVLTARFCDVLGVDPAALTETARWNNETMGVAAVEVVRRVNQLLEQRLNQRQYDRAIKLGIAQDLARYAGDERFVLPEEEVGWVRGEAQRHIDAIRSAGYDVVGQLDELLPSPIVGRRPDDVTDTELADTALVALAAMAQRHATSWWNRRRDDPQVATGRFERLRSDVRGGLFRVQRRAVELADRGKVGRRLIRVYLDARTRARRAALRTRN